MPDLNIPAPHCIACPASPPWLQHCCSTSAPVLGSVCQLLCLLARLPPLCSSTAAPLGSTAMRQKPRCAPTWCLCWTCSTTAMIQMRSAQVRGGLCAAPLMMMCCGATPRWLNAVIGLSGSMALALACTLQAGNPPTLPLAHCLPRSCCLLAAAVASPATLVRLADGRSCLLAAACTTVLQGTPSSSRWLPPGTSGGGKRSHTTILRG